MVQLGVYFALSIKRLRAHSKAIRETFSDIDQINLNWFKHLLVGLSCIFLLYLGDQLFPNLLGINILGDLITVVAVAMIYTMGYLVLRTGYLSQVINEQLGVNFYDFVNTYRVEEAKRLLGSNPQVKVNILDINPHSVARSKRSQR